MCVNMQSLTKSVNSFFVNFSFLDISFHCLLTYLTSIVVMLLKDLTLFNKARQLPISVHIVATAGLSSEAIVSARVMGVVTNSWHQWFLQAKGSLASLSLTHSGLSDGGGSHSRCWFVCCIWVEVSTLRLLLENDHNLANLCTGQFVIILNKYETGAS